VRSIRNKAFNDSRRFRPARHPAAAAHHDGQRHGHCLFGPGSTGGVVNQVSKQPQLSPITAGTIAFGTDGTKRITADMGRAIEALPGAAVRLNLMANQNGIAQRNNAEYNRFGFAPSITLGLGTPTRFYFDYFHSQEYDTPDYGLPWLFGSPAPVKRNTFFGFRNDDYLRTDVDIVTARLEHDFNDSEIVLAALERAKLFLSACLPPRFVLLPSAAGEPFRVFLGAPDAGAAGSGLAIIDAEGTRILSLQDPRFYPAGERIWRWGRDLHAGAGLGPAWRALTVAAGLTLPLFSVTGLTMWLRRNRSRHRADAARRAALQAGD
jgi:hypothetical protein